MTDRPPTPQLSFGCASMGSRKSPEESLAALRRAHAAGVRWFDVAPSYGDGEAERVLGQFLREVGCEARVCTKAGIAPGRVSSAKRLVRPLVRAALDLAPGLRETIRRLRPPAEKQPITGALITRSIDESLARLGTEYVEVLALHDASPEEAAREDVLRALESARASGKARGIGIASSADAVLAALAVSELYDHVQYANNPYAPGHSEVVRALAARPIRLVTHSVFGNPSVAGQLAARIAGDAQLRGMMQAAGYEGDAAALARAFLPDHAIAAERTDIVIMSMYSPGNLAANLKHQERATGLDRAAIAAIAARISS